jgi:linoleoyl-CoA desaturase
MNQIRFEGRNAQFFSTLRARIDAYFTDNNIKSSGNWKLYSKTIILGLTLLALYVTLVFFTPATAVAVILCILLGVNFATIGFNVMHDGAHGSYSTKPWVNKMMAHSLNLMGGNAFFWNQKHNVAHHSFTNIEGADEDIDISPFMRVSSFQPKYWFHRFQHIYGLLLYCVTYLMWIFYQDFVKYFTGKVGDRDMKVKFTTMDHLTFWVTKLGYIAVFIGFPMYYVGLAPTLFGYTIVSMTTGFVIAVVFQLAHVVEDVTFVEKTSPVTSVEADWATHQIQTTANFGTKSKFLAWMLGGLNFQVEHHLFPKISHIHYPKLNKIVRETCEEFKITYKEFPTMLSAVHSHLLHLKHVGA